MGRAGGLQVTTACPNTDFIITEGCTGVGKTHLLRRLERSIQNSFSAACKAEPSRVPVLFTLAVASGARSYDFRRLYRDALTALGDPFTDVRPYRAIAPDQRRHREPLSTSELRRALEDELRERKTAVWIIDEAQHILLGARHGALDEQFDVLKSIAQTTRVKIVLCGTHELPALLRLSGQVMRRSSTVVFERYQETVEEDVRQFASIVQALLKLLPMDNYPDVRANIDAFYRGTLGCVGVLKDWISRAWALTMDHFAATRMDDQALEMMAHEISWAEEGHGLQEWRLSRAKRTEELATRVAALTKGKGRGASSRKPGERLPARDRVGPIGGPKLVPGAASV